MAAKKTSAIPWHRAAPAPLVLIWGPEDVLIRRSRDTLLAKVRKKHPDIDITRLSASSYDAGALSAAAAPSLFSESGCIVVDGLESCSDDFLLDALAYVEDPNPDMVVVLEHRGGQRGAKLIKRLEALGAPKLDAQALKSESDRQDFAVDSFRRAERRIDPRGLEALMSALGSDLSELDAGIRQLLADTEGTITEEVVDRYYGGRVEATGFRVADAAVAGRAGEALALLRHSLGTGSDPVPIVAAIALKLRQLAKVQGLGGSNGELAGQLGMAPWQVDRAKREMRRWNEVALGRAILRAASADEAVKGGGRDPVYAVEDLIAFVAEQSRVR